VKILSAAENIIAYGLLLWMILPISIGHGETFTFKRMWPLMEEQWYFQAPYGLASDSKGAVYVADTENHHIHKFSPEGKLIAR